MHALIRASNHKDGGGGGGGAEKKRDRQRQGQGERETVRHRETGRKTDRQ